MSELGKKIATRESYGNALVELGKEHEDLIWQVRQRPAFLRRHFRSATGTSVLQRRI